MYASDKKGAAAPPKAATACLENGLKLFLLDLVYEVLFVI
jgi:hypothetical protein